MHRTALCTGLLGVLLLILMAASCQREKIVESTEYVHDVEYVQLPPDTIIHTDTVYRNDSVTVHTVDTVRIIDTVVQINHVYDTVVVTDTILTVRCDPNEFLAIAALEYHCDPLVIEFINQQFGYNDGWVLYLSAFQVDLTRQSSDVYDVYGYIDYWTPDWSGYYPLEFYWRMVYTGGDPADPDNWDLTEPPTAAPAGHQPGIRISKETSQAYRSLN
jgi:hypothetical protein